MKYDDIKKKKCHRYLVFYIKDEKMIAVEKIGKLFKSSSFEIGVNASMSKRIIYDSMRKGNNFFIL